MKNRKVAVFAGDERQEYLAKLFEKEYEVTKIYKKSDLDEVFDVYILPTPISKDGINISNDMELAEVIQKIPEKSMIFAGSVSKSVEKLFSNHKMVDFLKKEELAVLNAIPTTEGAIQIAFEEMPITLSGSKALVIGNGRIGKILSKKLHLLGADVTVSARKKEDFADITSNNLKFTYINDADVENFDVIFNTVPYLVLDEKILDKILKHTVIIDLASSPGGVDFDYAKKKGKNIIWALSLPAKVAPKTASKYIFDTVIDILYELEVKK